MTTFTKKSKQKKILQYALLLALVAALIIAGTFTYSNLVQTAINPLTGSVAHGARLHDDFDEASALFNQQSNKKQIYVENYGTSPLIVRIKLKEYLEIVSIPEGSNGSTAGSITNVITTGASVEKASPSSWIAHVEGGSNPASKYFEWGNGPGTDLHSIYYLPTDDVSDASIAVDNIISRSAYSDPSGSAVAATFTSVPAFYSSNTLGNGDTLYNASGKAVDSTLNLEHLTMTMTEWIGLGKPTGNFWVGDTDGWYYWANELLPGKATYPILQDVNRKASIQEDMYYYGIDVELQVVTGAERQEFGTAAATGGGGGITDNGGDLVSLAAMYGANGIPIGSQGVGTVFTSGGKGFNVLYVDVVKRKALINATAVFPSPYAFNLAISSGKYADTATNNTLNTTYFDSLSQLLQRQIIPTTIYNTRAVESATYYDEQANAKVFIPTNHDFSGLVYGRNASASQSGLPDDPSKRTVPNQLLDVVAYANSMEDHGVNLRMRTRSSQLNTAPSTYQFCLVGTQADGISPVLSGNVAADNSTAYSILPIMWIDLTVFR